MKHFLRGLIATEWNPPTKKHKTRAYFYLVAETSTGRVLSFVFGRMLIQVCLYFYCKFLWRCLKFVMRKLTGRCELQRICYNTKPGASRTMKIETSLRDSKSKLLQTSVSVHPDAIEKTIEDIMELKKINPDINPQLGISLQACLLQIVGYRNLIADVEKLRREPYDSDNPQHEEMLLKLWKFLKPNTPLESRISKQWCEIGFQGILQKGMLQQLSRSSLILFIQNAANSAKQNGRRKGWIKQLGYLMHEFHKFWIEEDPMDIMEFNRVREKFRKRIIKQLQNPDMALCPHFAASEGLINM
ncbi:ELMO domain-containing protein 1 isoform X5 [Hippopotamus amphibius kiboko]|uniref:ELMO domain-containing protein 1 isoform X5 n=1 Tax=Hippopotamus amphibius kiboko TaxID=575201 RepID=UPI002599E6E5|nr:ELMO domain-containing protein 1 isoform X5 [Hippopotamus amphibius kiboko]